MRRIAFDVNDAGLRTRFLGQDLAEALAPLDAGARSAWGAMTAQQMVEHLQWGFEISVGRVVVDCTVPEPKRARLKPFLFNGTPMIHDFRNPALASGLPALRHAGLAEARAALALEADRFLEHECTAPEAVHTHPVFGPLTALEWSRAHFKHAYHHLLQFALIEE